MIPFAAIFERAARDARVRTVAAVVTAVAVLFFGFRIVFGSTVSLQTDAAQKCAVDLADKSARLELTDRAMVACSTALQSCSGR